MEFIELITLACVIGGFILGTVILLKKTDKKRKPRDTVVETWKIVAEEKDLALVAMRKELDRQRGRANRSTTLLQQYESGMSEETNTEEPISIDSIKPLLKTLLPKIDDSQIALAMEIPQVKELLGSIGTEKNFALIKQLMPLLTKKKDESQIQTENQELWA